jgi:hypothetical protein
MGRGKVEAEQELLHDDTILIQTGARSDPSSWSDSSDWGNWSDSKDSGNWSHFTASGNWRGKEYGNWSSSHNWSSWSDWNPNGSSYGNWSDTYGNWSDTYGNWSGNWSDTYGNWSDTYGNWSKSSGNWSSGGDDLLAEAAEACQEYYSFDFEQCMSCGEECHKEHPCTSRADCETHEEFLMCHAGCMHSPLDEAEKACAEFYPGLEGECMECGGMCVHEFPCSSKDDCLGNDKFMNCHTECMTHSSGADDKGDDRGNDKGDEKGECDRCGDQTCTLAADNMWKPEDLPGYFQCLSDCCQDFDPELIFDGITCDQIKNEFGMKCNDELEGMHHIPEGTLLKHVCPQTCESCCEDLGGEGKDEGKDEGKECDTCGDQICTLAADNLWKPEDIPPYFQCLSDCCKDFDPELIFDGITCKQIKDEFGMKCDDELEGMRNIPEGTKLKHVCPETCDACCQKNDLTATASDSTGTDSWSSSSWSSSSSSSDK